MQATSGSAAAGTTRIVNLGVAAFFGLGAFVCAALLPVVELPVALVAAAGAGMALGLVPAPIAGRLTGVFMAILTVGLTLLARCRVRSAGSSAARSCSCSSSSRRPTCCGRGSGGR